MKELMNLTLHIELARSGYISVRLDEAGIQYQEPVARHGVFVDAWQRSRYSIQ